MQQAKGAGVPFVKVQDPPDAVSDDGEVDSSVLSASEAEALFNDMASQDDIAFGYPKDGCYARAHLMTQRMEERGIEPGKVWSFANPDLLYVETLNSPEGYVEWGYHVAPTVPVEQSDGSISNMVIDPSMFDKPVSIEDWSSAQQRAGRSEPYITETELGEAPMTPIGRVPGSGYWPGNDPDDGVDEHARETMEDYLRRQRRMGID